MSRDPDSYEARVGGLAHGAAIDLRSDTVTQPTAAMREAMYRAEVGDDVYGEDPTINRLEERAAEMVGKEAAIFVPTGTMGNAAAILTHCRRGDEIIVGDRSHIYLYEVGGAARLNGSAARVVPNLPDGRLDPARLEASFLGDDVHEARTGLLCVENTHNMCGGRALSPTTLRALTSTARRRGVPVHMDGARLFNAAVALGVPVRDLVAEVDSVMFCLSKGLSAPVGSMLAGSRAFIAEARRTRKLLGGGMRQAGVLAAAGLVALDEMVDRLAEDHTNAQRLAQGLAELPGVRIAPAAVESNILFFDVIGEDEAPHNDEFTRAAAAGGALFSSGDLGAIRAVTHSGISASDIDRTLDIARAILAG
ncbi:MAG TPA: low-specificity L-threonine aldolase [Ktedonobacterales bacterium]|jgi:threonine aldolase|nr:low-specificity L-threonine aldolase [Ktedonobacterales bacterium]